MNLPDAPLTTWLAERIDSVRRIDLDEDVRVAALDRIVDSVAAAVSGGGLPPGKAARSFTADLGGTAEATIIGSPDRVPAIHAAMANAMMAHADETDDVDLVTKAHPGSSVVPTALAMAERQDAAGEQVVRATVAGYDLGCRILRGLNPDVLASSGRSLQGIASTFGCAAAAGLLADVDAAGLRHVLSFAAQQTSGIGTWPRDPDHVEKAFDLAGMGARNGVYAATMVEAGMTGVENVFDGTPSVLSALSPQPDEAALDRDTDSWLIGTAIKRYPVGYPIQAGLDAVRVIQRGNRLSAADVKRVILRLPPDGARIVDGRRIPSINAQHVIALAIVDGEVTFDTVHDLDRFHDERVRAIVEATELVPDPSQWDREATRQATVEVIMRNGDHRTAHIRFAKGTTHNPMTSDEVDDKARDLIDPILGSDGAKRLIALLRSIDRLDSLAEAYSLLRVSVRPHERVAK